MELENKIYLYLLFILPVFGAFFAYHIFWKSKKQKEFGNPDLIKKLSPESSSFKPTLKFVLLLVSMVAIIFALANPKMGTKLETVKREGIDIVFAVDVSKSMLARDVAPNRLEKSKQIVSQIINQLTDDRIGIVGYAGSAFPLLPITSDYSVAKMFLQNLNTEIVSSQGTSLEEAITLSNSFFDKKNKTSKLLILISDGEDHSEGATAAAEEANKSGTRILTVGVGTEKGSTIPNIQNGVAQGLKKDNEGNVVISKRNAEALTEIARSTNGDYIDGNNTKEVLEFVKKHLSKIQKSERESTELADFESQYQWLVAFAFLILFVDLFLLERKTKWVSSLNLFDEKKSDN